MREGGEIEESMYVKISNMSPSSRNPYVYDQLIDDERYVLKYSGRWQEKLEDILIAVPDYLRGFKVLNACTKTTKYHDFQYRLMLNKIFTNVDMYEWGIMLSDRCTFCNVEAETVLHILCY